MSEQQFAPASVYLVTSGSYSDYGVDGVFSTREKAEAWIAANPRGGPRIEVLPLDDPASDAPDGAWHVVVDGRGTVTRSAWENGENPRKPAAHVPPRYGFAVHIFAGYGPTQEHARRSAEELRRATIAGTVVSEPTHVTG